MKRKHDGWHTLELNGKAQTCFCYNGTIARHTPENDPDFREKIESLLGILRNRLRPGKLTTKGKPYKNSVLSRWLCDVCNHFWSGKWSGQDISESHLNLIAKDLGWPEVWRPGGDVMYCVDCGDFMSIAAEIDGSPTGYQQNRIFEPLDSSR